MSRGCGATAHDAARHAATSIDDLSGLFRPVQLCLSLPSHLVPHCLIWHSAVSYTAMPELRESWVSAMYLRWIMERHPDFDWSVRAVWHDANDQDIKRWEAAGDPKYSPSCLHAKGFMEELTKDSRHAPRGNEHHQLPLWPKPWDTSLPDCPSMQSLHLRGVYETPRTVVLDLGPLWFQVSPLSTHDAIFSTSYDTDA